MTAKAFSRGHPIEWNGKEWVYSDNLRPDYGKRPCKHCGRKPTSEGYDACLGYIEEASSACCGHGVEKPYTKKIK